MSDFIAVSNFAGLEVRVAELEDRFHPERLGRTCRGPSARENEREPWADLVSNEVGPHLGLLVATAGTQR